MSKRIQSRRGNGRWQKNTLENTFGLTTRICPHCNGINPFGVNDEAPTVCCQCGKSLLIQNEPEVTSYVGEVEVCCHRVWFSYNRFGSRILSDDDKQALTEAAEDRAREMIVGGYREGELNHVLDGNFEIHGWWGIKT